MKGEAMTRRTSLRGWLRETRLSPGYLYQWCVNGYNRLAVEISTEPVTGGITWVFYM